MNELSNDWKEDCLHFWGKVLTGKYCHWCADWDYLSLDETCHPFAYCNCERDEWDMNEKIKELAEQAEEAARKNNPYWQMSDEFPEDKIWREKFAELIIQECSNVVNDFALQLASEPEHIFNILGENLLVSIKITDAAHKIKEHFGVE
jgi:hypothetical protein